jgi:hypothetical protein
MIARIVNPANRSRSTKKEMRGRADRREGRRMTVRRLNRNSENESERRIGNAKTNKDREGHVPARKSTFPINKDLDSMTAIEINAINKDPARKNTNAGEESSASDLTVLRKARTPTCLTIPRKWIS